MTASPAFHAPRLVIAVLACLHFSTGTLVAENEGDYFPPTGRGEWQKIEPAAAGFDAAGLAEVLRYAEGQRSSALVILYDGRILAEGYWQPISEEDSRYSRMVVAEKGERSVEDVASVQKSVVSFLVGVAEGRGLLELEAPVNRYLGAGWSKASPQQEERIRIGHLLTMTSGLGTDHSYEAPAGERWRYNTNVYSRLLSVLEKASGLSTDEYTRRWLTEPIGMNESRWAKRPWVRGGQDANRVGFATSARDLARFGLLMLRGGRWHDQDLLANPSWIERSAGGSPAGPNPAYGFLWWLNGRASGTLANGTPMRGPLIENAPDDLFAAMGALGRKCYVAPSKKLVAVRLGDQPEQNFDEELWRLIAAARVGKDSLAPGSR